MSLTAAKAITSPGRMPLPVVWLNRSDALWPIASIMQVPGIMANSGKWPSSWSSLPVTFLRVFTRLPGLEFEDSVHHQHRIPLLEAAFHLFKGHGRHMRQQTFSRATYS